MKVKLNRKNNNFHFVAESDNGNSVSMDASPAIGGENKGVRPMEMLLMAIGGCSGIDVVSILKKQKQEIKNFSIEVDGEREAGKEPSLYKHIEVVFLLEGDMDPSKAKRAVELSMDKYCSVAKTLEKTAEINYSVKLNGVRI
ncbi:MAG: OsmC family protein [Bacteroidota bacterium]